MPEGSNIEIGRSDPVLANKHDGSVLRREYQLHLVRNLFVEPPVSVPLASTSGAPMLPES